MSSGGNGKAAPEVIQEWADGEGAYSFERGRMEAAVRNLCFEQPVQLKKAPATAKSAVKLNREDVDFIVKELMVPRPQAEEALAAHEGDVEKTLIQLMTPPKTSSESAATA